MTHEDMLEEAARREAHNSTDKCFEEWFNDLYGLYSYRSEWFYGDCEVEEPNARKVLLRGWLRDAFIAGYEAQRNQKEP